MSDVAEHTARVTHRYRIHYPPHPERESDPFYPEFREFRRRTKDTAKCAVGEARNDYSECHGGLQVHHSHIEFSQQNGVNFSWLEAQYPGISDPTQVGEWIESDQNLMWLCQEHHIGGHGIHVLSSSDFEAQKFVPGMIVE